MLRGSWSAATTIGALGVALLMAAPSADASLLLSDPYPGGSTFVDVLSFGNTYAYDEMVIHITEDDGFGPFADPPLMDFSDPSWAVVHTSTNMREVAALGNTVQAGGWLAYRMHLEGTPDFGLQLSFAFYNEGAWVDGALLDWTLGNPNNPYAPSYWNASLLTQDDFDPGSNRQPVPEPTTLALTGIGLGFLGLRRRLRRRSA